MRKIFCFDIDGVVATLVPGNDYRKARPILKNIRIVNRLFDKGHRIIFYSARGSATGILWRAFTKRQLKKFGVRYHELHLGKPAADFYVDDKMTTLNEAGRV